VILWTVVAPGMKISLRLPLLAGHYDEKNAGAAHEPSKPPTKALPRGSTPMVAGADAYITLGVKKEVPFCDWLFHTRSLY